MTIANVFSNAPALTGASVMPSPQDFVALDQRLRELQGSEQSYVIPVSSMMFQALLAARWIDEAGRILDLLPREAIP